MTQDLGTRIAEQAQALTALIRSKSTESVVSWCASYHMAAASDVERKGEELHSKHRQIQYLVGLLLNTPEPDGIEPLEEAEWAKVRKQLNSLFNSYNDLFLPSAKEVWPLPPEWVRVRDVAMPAFLNHFFSGLLASVEQVRNRIMTYVAPFDSELETLLGISATDALSVAGSIANSFQDRADKAFEAGKTEKKARLALLRGSKSIEEIRQRAEDTSYRSVFDAFLASTNELFKIRSAGLADAFGSKAEAFWNAFTIGRGDGPPLIYPTELSAVETRPLVRISSDVAMCVTVNSLYFGILRATETALLNDSTKLRFTSRRDAELEDETGTLFKRILGKEGQLFPSAYETRTGHLEHDLVAVSGKTAFIIEAKASPPTEPFRDPEKAFTRIQRAFRSDSGIQKAYEQATRIKRRLDDGELVELYSKAGDVVTALNPKKLARWFCIGVTRDDFGALATDLALLLEKNETEPYPWMVNVLDLEAIADAWSYLGWGLKEFVSYLRERAEMHGRMFSADELDFVGCYIRHGSLKSMLPEQNDLVVLNPTYSGFFDELYAHQNFGGPAPRSSVGEPVITDLKKSLAADHPVFVPLADSRRSSPGRNDRCPCGSGKKYKKCCGSTGSAG